ncbi:hypothetical protein DZK27_11595 [Rhodobacteraceae bacterium 63075]|nr:hypothetical protein DZK27_11595 [Rhodobacteraceae bacterium 63075]
MCYCDDCQAFAEMIGRADVMDKWGGTEIVPAYPCDITILKGGELLCHSQVPRKRLHRFSTTCCNAPIANAMPGFPWVGLFHSVYSAADPDALGRFGKLRSRIMGRYAKGAPNFKISDKISMRDMLVVLPFIMKGKIFGKHKGSPFFEAGGATPIGRKRA